MTKETGFLALSGLIAVAFGARLDLSHAHPEMFMIGIAYLGASAVFLLAALSVHLLPSVTRLAIACGFCIALSLITLPNVYTSPIVLVVFIALLPYVYSERVCWAILVAINAIFLSVICLAGRASEVFFTGLAFVGFQIFAMSSSLLRSRMEQQNSALEKAHLDLLMAQAQLKEQNRADERVRIARDLHDSIGQQLTGLSLRVEHARHKPPEDLSAYFTKLRQDLKATLTELRSIVSEFREFDHADIAERLQGLISDIPQVSLQSEDPIYLPSPLNREVFHCLQEGIHNAIRHGKANQLQLAVIDEGDCYVIELRDNGQGVLSSQLGNGLKGMEERLSCVQGSVVLLDDELGGACLRLSWSTTAMEMLS